MEQPLEIERKYLIRKPSAEKLEALNCFSVTDIVQIYLTDGAHGESRRIRRRGNDTESYRCYYTEKTHVTAAVRIENEKIITEAEYEELKQQADPERHPIEKTRYCFQFEGRVYELDIFPFSDELAFLEIEVDDPKDFPETLPPLDIIRDVTEEGSYTNKALAKTGKLIS